MAVCGLRWGGQPDLDRSPSESQPLEIYAYRMLPAHEQRPHWEIPPKSSTGNVVQSSSHVPPSLVLLPILGMKKWRLKASEQAVTLAGKVSS